MSGKQSAAMDRALQLVRAGYKPTHAAMEAGVSRQALAAAMKRHGLAFKRVLVETT